MLEKFFKKCLANSRIVVKDTSRNVPAWDFLHAYRGILINVNQIYAFFLDTKPGISFAYQPRSPVKLEIMDETKVADLLSNWEKYIKKAANFHVFPKL